MIPDEYKAIWKKLYSKEHYEMVCKWYGVKP